MSARGTYGEQGDGTAAFKEKLSATNEHTSMAQEYARQAIAAARKRP